MITRKCKFLLPFFFFLLILVKLRLTLLNRFPCFVKWTKEFNIPQIKIKPLTISPPFPANTFYASAVLFWITPSFLFIFLFCWMPLRPSASRADYHKVICKLLLPVAGWCVVTEWQPSCRRNEKVQTSKKPLSVSTPRRTNCDRAVRWMTVIPIAAPLESITWS